LQLHPHVHPDRSTTWHELLESVEELPLEEPNLRGPGRVVDGDRQLAVTQRRRPGVRGHFWSDQLKPCRFNMLVVADCGAAEVPDEAIKCIAHWRWLALG
jgi:hypothetical protein